MTETERMLAEIAVHREQIATLSQICRSLNEQTTWLSGQIAWLDRTVTRTERKLYGLEDVVLPTTTSEQDAA